MLVVFLYTLLVLAPAMEPLSVQAASCRPFKRVVGDNFHYYCSILPGKVVHRAIFRRNGGRVQERPPRITLSQNGFQLSVESVTPADAGPYFCTGVNAKNEIIDTDCVNLQISTKPRQKPNIDSSRSSPGTIKATIGMPLVIRCPSSEAIKVWWYKNGKFFISPDSYRVYWNNTSQSLHFARIELSDNATYYCEARNTVGSTKRYFTLIVQGEGRFQDSTPSPSSDFTETTSFRSQPQIATSLPSTPSTTDSTPLPSSDFTETTSFRSRPQIATSLPSTPSTTDSTPSPSSDFNETTSFRSRPQIATSLPSTPSTTGPAEISVELHYFLSLLHPCKATDLPAGYGLGVAWKISSLIPKQCKACNIMYPKGVPDVITNSTTSTCPETFFEIRAKILITGKDLRSMYASLVQPIQLGSYKVIAEDEKRDKSEWKVSRFCAIHEATSFEHCWSQESNPVEHPPTPGNIRATRILSSPSSAASGLHSIQQNIIHFHQAVATLAFVFFCLV